MPHVVREGFIANGFFMCSVWGAVTLIRSEHLSVLFLLHVYELFLAVIELVLQECELL